MGNQHAGAAMRQAAADGDFDAVQSIGKHNARACSAPHPKVGWLFRAPPCYLVRWHDVVMLADCVGARLPDESHAHALW